MNSAYKKISHKRPDNIIYSIKMSSDMSQRKKLEMIDSEVKSFYEYCEQAGFTDKEMDAICRPLTNAILRASVKKWLKVALLLCMVLVAVFIATRSDMMQWHASAVGRIVLIKLLPLWDWRPLFYHNCILEKANKQHEEANELSVADCSVCEAVGYVERIAETDYSSLLNQHLIRGAPVIVMDVKHSVSYRQPFNITKLLGDDERLRDSVPCRMQTNIRTGRQPADLQEIFLKITSTETPHWFVHFQNCDIQVVKSLRILAPRPYFLPPHIRPAHFNWLLLSNRYNAPRLKYLELDVGLIIVSQLKGHMPIVLRPRTPCEEMCPKVQFGLEEGETLVLANSMWEFEYLPDENGENVAIITETDWNEA